MSIFFEFDAGPKGRRLRRAVDQDKVDIQGIWNPEETETLFCVSDFGSLIELSTLSICMIDEQLNVTGFMALSDHPPLPAVDAASWETWMRNMFQKYYLARNTLFIHFMCCVEPVSEFFLEETLVSVFMNDFYLQQIILVVPPACKIDCIAKYPSFKRRNIYRHCTKFEDVETCYCLFVAMRQDFCPQLRVRRAVEEDNDDILNILDKKCKKLKGLYGDYFISEILSRHPESQRTIIVAETRIQHKDKVVGVMCLNPEVNYEKLQHIYELTPYHGLVLMEPIAREAMKRSNSLLQTFGDPIMRGEWSPFEQLDKQAFVHGSLKEVIPREQQRKPKSSKVNFRTRRMKVHRSSRRATRHNSSQDSDKTGSPTLSLTADISLMFLMDDEPLEYEIVNIDETLFTVPEVSSSDNLQNFNIKECESDSGHQLRKKRSTMAKLDESGPLFEGKPNAFIIELFGLENDIDERRAFDLLEAAFECMPQYDYCIIRTPSSQKTFPLLHHFCFVPSKPHVCCRYALYIAHRNSVLGKLRVRKAEYADIPQIAMLLKNVDGKETIWTIENTIENCQHHLAFVFFTGYTIIGVGILDPPEHTDLVRAKFIMEDYQHIKYHIAGQGLDGGFAMLKTVLVYPAFEPHFSFFAREMMRQSGSTTLMWLTAYRNKWVAHKANGIVTAMTPLPFRMTAESGLLPELKQVYNLSKNLLSFSAWFVSKKLTSIAKLNVDTRIVVVGASRTAISFLYNLLFRDSAAYLTFTNVTLISTNGLPYLRHPVPASELMFPRFQTTCDRFLKSTPFTYYVNIVQATMVDINKQDKCIITDTGSRFYYDKLFLLIGKQHQHPDYLRALTRRERHIKLGKIPEYMRVDNIDYVYTQQEPPTDFETPENAFIVNNVTDANRALNYVRTFFWRYEEYKVVVYGSCIDAYCCISALLELGVEPQDIYFVEPFPPVNETKSRVPLFCNTKVDQTVQAFLLALKIHILRGYYFQSWTVDEDNVLQSVDYISHYKLVTLECNAFFYYEKRYINPSAFVAINKCGLAYDGGILIDHQFRTNDPAIYAAGPATRYYPRYHANDMLLKFYDSYEIGKKLAVQIRDELDPFFKETLKQDGWVREEPPSTPSSTCRCSSSASCTCRGGSSDSLHSEDAICYKCLIPKFSRPVVWYCMLPGGLQYLEVRPPGTKFPHYYIQAMNYNGYVLETFKSGYFKVRLNKELIVEGITCLTPDKRSIENFKRLFGYSAVVLNNLHLRFNAGTITDLYEFFRLPWSWFLYNERSKELLKVAEHLKPKGNPKGKTLEESLRDINEKVLNAKLDAKAMFQVRSNFEKNFEAITDYVIEWLTDNELMMPIYMTPSNMLEFSHDLPRHPAFKRCKRTIKKMLAMIS